MRDGSAKQGAQSTLADADKFGISRLQALRGIFKGELKAWQTFAALRQKLRPNLDNFIAKSRVDSLIDGKISQVLIASDYPFNAAPLEV